MLEGLYSAAAGMAAQQQRLEALSNDVANMSTSGYKRTRVASLTWSTGSGHAPPPTASLGAPARPPR